MKQYKGLKIIVVLLAMIVGIVWKEVQKQQNNQPRVYSKQDIVCIDGDTFIINGEKVRLLAIDTPEIEHKGKEGNIVGINEPYGLEAKEFTCSILKDPERTIALDRRWGYLQDKYGRSLYIVRVDNYKTTLQSLLLQEGLAKIDYISDRMTGDYDFQRMIDAESEAQKQKINIWSK